VAVSIRFKGKIKFPDIDLTDELKDVADKIIIPDIAGHIQERKDITGKSYKSLAASTVRQKARSGTRKASPTHQLIGKEGKLFSASTYFPKKKSKHSYSIQISSERADIAKYLQVDGVKSKAYGRRKFKFFGVSRRAEKKSIKFMQEAIRKWIKSA
jgi:hypothetical protein